MNSYIAYGNKFFTAQKYVHSLPKHNKCIARPEVSGCTQDPAQC